MAKRKMIDEPTEEEQHGFVEGAKRFDEIEMPEFMAATRLPYAMSVIRDRALIDSRDGLKPVQRRILWTMYEDKVTPTAGYMKVARLAGNVLRYHPHGNSSVEGALTRMAQPYSLRVPFIDGKGAFGSHPGDDPAAARYIEARLNRAAMELLEESRSNCVRMLPNFDGTLKEPEVLPVRYPVSVVNGSSGIAVGYAANMPQHNPTEALKACKLLLKNPDATIKQIMRVMPGPDFWTGGIVYGVDGIAEYYETGKGSFSVRSKYNLEYQQRGKARITFYELPPLVSCEKVVEEVRSLIKTNPIFKGISRCDNLTGRVNENDVRLVIETKAGANAKAILAALFKNTSLQTTFAVNNTVVRNGKPVLMGVKALLLDFIKLRKDCVLNRSKTAIDAKNHRIHQIDSILAVLLDIDKAISIIRKSDDADVARGKLMKTFKIDDEQADYVLNMQLRRLTKQDSVALKTEKKQLQDDIKHLQEIIDDPEVLKATISDEFDKEIKIVGTDRKMEISGLTLDEAKDQEKTEARTIKNDGKDVNMFVYMLANGKAMKSPVKVTSMVEASASGAGNGQAIAYGFKTSSKSRIAAIGSDGVEYAASSEFISDGEQMTAAKLGIVPSGVSQVALLPDESDVDVLIVTKLGKIRRYNLPTNGKWDDRTIMNVADGDEVVAAIDLSKSVKNSTIIIVTALGRCLRFALDSLSAVSPGAQGISGMNADDDDYVAAVTIAKPNSKELITKTKRTVKVTPLGDIPIANRGGKGTILHRIAGADRIDDAAVDAIATNGKKALPLPKPTPRAGRVAPFAANALLSN